MEIQQNTSKYKVNLGTVQETLLITLWARGTEAGKPDTILKDTKSVEVMNQIDYDFSKLATATASQIGICLRGQILDQWVQSFLKENPDGIIVEIGAGLNTRFERVDNGSVRWFDLDLPDAIAMRQNFFQECDRRQFIAASALDSHWVEIVKKAGARPMMFVAEGVLMYLTEEQVKHLFALIYKHFPSSYFVFDSLSQFVVKHQKHHDAIKYYEARFQWGIKDIRNIHNWNPHYQVLEIKTLYDTPPRYYRRMGFVNNLIFRIPPFSRMYRLSLVKLG